MTRHTKHPQNGIPALFVFNALLIASNGTDSRVGSLTADWERFFEVLSDGHKTHRARGRAAPADAPRREFFGQESIVNTP